MKRLSLKNEFYVYGLVDPRNSEVFYVGKGKGNRAYNHLIEEYYEGKGNKDKIKRIESVIGSGDQVDIHYYAKNLIERHAYILEEIIIFRIGRKCYGYGNLTNLEAGNDVEEKIANSLYENETETLKQLKTKLPALYDIVISVPKTTKEPELRGEWDRVKNEKVNKCLDFLEYYDLTLIADLDAKNIDFFNNFPGNAIEFDSIIGHIELSFNEESENESSLKIKKAGEIIVDKYLCLELSEITEIIRGVLIKMIE